MKWQIYIIRDRDNSDLPVEIAVQQWDEESLEGDQEVSGVGPESELDHALRGGIDQVHNVRDAQQRQQNNGGLHGFPEIQSIIILCTQTLMKPKLWNFVSYSILIALKFWL